MTELRTLFWVQTKIMRSGLRYWLRVLGFTQGRTILEWIYEGYALGLAAALSVLLWLDALTVAHDAGQVLIGDAAMRAALIGFVPAVVLALQVVLSVVAASSSPMKLSLPEVDYLAASPVPRPVAVAAVFARGLAPRLMLVALAAALCAAWVMPNYDTIQAAALTSLPVTLLTVAVAWVVGLGRLCVPKLLQRRLTWLVPLALGSALLFLVPWAQWPGRVFVMALQGGPSAGSMLWLLLLALAATAGVLQLGSKLHLTDVADESRRFALMRARRPSLSVAWTNPAAASQIRSETSLAGVKPYLALPDALGSRIIMARTALGYLRRRALLLGLLRDVSVVLSGLFVMASSGSGQSWIVWILWGAWLTPRSLTGGFASDMERPFLRRLIPYSNRWLLFTNAVMPAGFVAIICAVIWLLLGKGNVPLGLLFIPALIALRVTCAGLSSSRTLFQGQVRLPSFALTGLSFGSVAVVAVLMKRPWPALWLAVMLCVVFAALLQPLGRKA